MRTLQTAMAFCISLGWLFASVVTAQATRERLDMDVIKKIKDEGMQRSKVMETISFLTDVHGPRLTGSPQTKAAGE